ncbi:MAG TPA: hypothetical protein VE242_15260 [Chthoniobacterales bacterium]|nr:hypothetical protein [Chthoniobacterales bacterium]
MKEQVTSRGLRGAVKSRELSGTEAALKTNWTTKVEINGIRRAGYVGALITLLALSPSAGALGIPDGSGNQILPIQPSTVPANGDLNPYGVAFVPTEFPGGVVHPGDILVSNFNNSTNAQGTGTTIVSVSPNGQTSLFFQGTPPLGLTTALGVLKKGFVIVGNVPTTNGSNPQAGSLLVLDYTGKVVATFNDARLLDGPWDLAIQDNGNSALVFVSCVLNGTVTRLDLTVGSTNVTLNKETQIASGYMFAPNAAALVVGPTGLAYDPLADVLYVASTADNEIFAVAGAATATSSSGTGKVIYQDTTHLHGPLGLVLAPNGNLISSQGDAINPDPAHQSEIVEFTKTGKFVAQFSIDSAVGAAFGIAIAPADIGAVDFAAVDDATNTLTVFEFSVQ